METKKLTAAFITTTIVIIGLFDIYVYNKGGTEATISHVMMTWSYNHPVFTFGMGFVMGHLFWRIRDVSAKGE